MRSGPFHSRTRNNDPMDLGAVLLGYAALAVTFVFFVAVLVTSHRHETAPKPTHAGQDAYFGLEELADLLAEPAVPPADLFVLPKPRSIIRAELDAKHSR